MDKHKVNLRPSLISKTGSTSSKKKRVCPPPPRLENVYDSSIPFVDPFPLKKRKTEKPKDAEEDAALVDPPIELKPPLNTRVELARHRCFTLDLMCKPLIKYEMPKSEKEEEEARKRLQNWYDSLRFCEYPELKAEPPKESEKLEIKMEMTSPKVSKAHVMPKKPSFLAHQSYPDLPTAEDLELKKPKSGIFVNVDEKPKPKVYDSFDLVYHRKPRPKEDQKRKKKKKKPKKIKEEIDEELLGETLDHDELVRFLEGLGEEFVPEEEEDSLEESYLTKLFRRKVSQASKATSLNEKELMDFPQYQDMDIESEPALEKIVQKFRRDSEVQRYRPPPRKIQKGTLESHSFTKIKQKTLKIFFFGSQGGTMHQGDEHFSETSRNMQGICMPVAAYCYSTIKHPAKWTDQIIDDILELGDQFYSDSLKAEHVHEGSKQLRGQDLLKFMEIENKRIYFTVSEPEVSGTVRSKNKNIYNLTHALKIFYRRHCAGIFQAEGVNILIWRDQFYYFFDATPRMRDLYPEEKFGTAVVANLYDLTAVATILLKRTDLGNQPFVISEINLMKIKRKGDDEEEDAEAESPPQSALVSEQSNYNIVGTGRAVVQASFDLADRCFGFARNKQATTMAAVCLAYSRISPPNAWRKRTLDKIMMIGNQLYIECAQEEDVIGAEVGLNNLPAVFTIGPYLINIFIYEGIYADMMYRKSQCQFLKIAEDFFHKNNNAIVQIGKSTLAIWNQRNMFYCFDPYSRNNQGLRARSGTGCVSMNADLVTLVDAITANFDNKDEVFHLHAVKVLKIHRDPELSQSFPISITMDSYPLDKFRKCKMKRSVKKATEKPVTVDFKELALKTIPAWESPEPSLFEIGSHVYSLNSEEIPPIAQKIPSKTVTKVDLVDQVADLDSPSLSDTQIEPDRLKYEEVEEIEDPFELTVEEQELMGEGLEDAYGEGASYLGAGDYEANESDVDEIDEMYLAMTQITQVHSSSLESYRSKISQEVNTDLTCGFLPLKRVELPPARLDDQKRWRRLFEKETQRLSIYKKYPDEVEPTASEELAKESNFLDLPDGSQIVSGTTSMKTYSEELEFMGPFVCMMAVAVANKFSIPTWSSQIVDYVLKCGYTLFKAAKVRYDQVPVLEIPRVSLGKTDFSILVEYLCDSLMKPSMLESAIEALFSEFEFGLVVTISYSAAVLRKNNLYYLYEGFPNNEVGLNEGPDDEGAASLSRFRTIHAMAARIIYNKSRTEIAEVVGYTKFVLSKCTVKAVRKPVKQEDKPAGQKKKEEEKEPQNKIGYQLKDGFNTIQGNEALKGPEIVANGVLKVDHFVCLCAGILLLNLPVNKWDTEKVDYVLRQGRTLYKQIPDKTVVEKRFISNVLVDKYFFDILVRKVKIEEYRWNSDLAVGIDTLLARKWDYFLIQLPNTCYLLHKRKEFYHLFDPYCCYPKGRNAQKNKGKGNGQKGKSNAQKGEDNEPKAGWTMYIDLNQVKNRIRSDMINRTYSFYSFELMTIKKAPKKVVLGQELKKYKVRKEKKPENLDDRPYFEDETWLTPDPIAWSRAQSLLASGVERRVSESVIWYEWDIELPNSLYSLFGFIHQTDELFLPEDRGKQTLSNLIVAIGMTQIYAFEKWNSAVLDSILFNGDLYFQDCIQGIEAKNYELSLEDLKPQCSIFPYTFEVAYKPVVEGTVFLLRPRQFNLYKGLRAFFDFYESRCGIIYVVKDSRKKIVAFGKTQEKEYFMFDCQSFGAPMFLTGEGSSYILRCTSLKRLLHVLVVTLRGGDFFIYEVEVSNFKPMK